MPDLTETGLKLRDRKRNERIASLQPYEIWIVREREREREREAKLFSEFCIFQDWLKCTVAMV
jgi:hypothetical protein